MPTTVQSAEWRLCPLQSLSRVGSTHYFMALCMLQCWQEHELWHSILIMWHSILIMASCQEPSNIEGAMIPPIINRDQFQLHPVCGWDGIPWSLKFLIFYGPWLGRRKMAKRKQQQKQQKQPPQKSKTKQNKKTKIKQKNLQFLSVLFKLWAQLYNTILRDMRKSGAWQQSRAPSWGHSHTRSSQLRLSFSVSLHHWALSIACLCLN